MSNYIEIVEQIDVSSWRIFLDENDNSNMFQTPEMLEIYNNTNRCKGVSLFALSNQKLVGVLIGCIIRESNSPLLKMLSSRLIIRGGPLAKNDNIDICSLLIRKMFQTSKNITLYSEYRNMRDIAKIKPSFNLNKYKYEEHLDILMDIGISEDDIMSRIRKNKRKEIKKALKKEIDIKVYDNYNHEVEKCYSLIAKLYKRLKIPTFDISLIKSSFEQNNEKFKTIAFGAYSNDTLIGTRIVYCYNKLIFDWYAAANDEYLDLRPNDILPYEVMKWGSNKGYKIFDFGGAGKPNVAYGVRDYKLRFGGETIELGRFKRKHHKVLYYIIESIYMQLQKIRRR